MPRKGCKRQQHAKLWSLSEASTNVFPGAKPLLSDHSRRRSEEAEEVQQQWREQQWAEQDQSLAADWQLGTASARDQPL